MELLHNYSDIDDTFLATEAPFDEVLSEEDAALRIPSGYYRFEHGMRATLAEKTGSPERFLTLEEEAALAKRIQAGQSAKTTLESDEELSYARRRRFKRLEADGMEARNTLVECNLRFAAYFARASMNIVPPNVRSRRGKSSVEPVIDTDVRDEDDTMRRERARTRSPGAYGDITFLRSRYADLEDRVQVAMEGLIKAAEKFRPLTTKQGKQVSFMSFSSWYIHQELSRYAPTEAPGLAVTAYKVKEARDGLDDPDITHEKREYYNQLLERRHTVPLEVLRSETYAVEEDEGSGYLQALPIADLVRDWGEWDMSQEVVDDALSKTIHEALDTLSEREASVVAMRCGIFGDKQATFDDIGKVYGVTRERIRQIESKAMNKLRHVSRSAPLYPFFEIPNTLCQSEALNTPELYERVPNLRIRHTDYQGPDAASRRIMAMVPAAVLHRDDKRLAADRSQQAEQHLIGHRHAAFMLRRIIRHADPVEFTATKQGDTRAGILFENVLDTFGDAMPSYYIEHGWDTMLRVIPRWERLLGEAVDTQKVSQFFSRLFNQYVSAEDGVTLHIPKTRAGAIHYLGTGITKGTLTIVGDAGDYLGAEAEGSARITVQGNAGDFAGTRIAGGAEVAVSGDAGRLLGLGARDGSLIVGGEVASALVTSKFRGEIVAGKIRELITYKP